MEIINVSVGVVVVVAVTLLYFIRRHFTYWSRHGVPGRNYIHIAGFRQPAHTYTLDCVKKFGKIFGAYALTNRVLFVNDPELIRDIMVKDFHIFPDHKKFHMGSTLFGLSLFFLPGDERWKRIRSIITPAFTSGKLRSMMESMHEIADQFVDNVSKIADKGESIDMRKYIGSFAMDVITSCAYGVKTDSLNNPDHPIVTNAKKILGFDANFSIIVSILAPTLAKLLRLEPFDAKAINYFDALTKKIVSDRKKLQQNETKINKKRDFLQLMMDTEKNEENETMSDDESFMPLEQEKMNFKSNGLSKTDRTLTADELTAQGILFFIAGYDTTSATLTHCFQHLSENQDCQQKLYEELLTINDFKYETLNKLKYLNAVISETLRLSPPLLRVDRDCVQDYILGNTGIKITAGTTVTFFPYALHRDADQFEDPEQFKPERFFSPKHHPYAYIPFGGGQRFCVGMRFAQNEMRVCVAKLIRKFKFEPMPDYKIQYFAGSIMYSPKELLLLVKNRN